MRLSSAIYLFFAGSSALAATTSSKRPTATPATAAKIATPRVLRPATPPTQKDVTNSIDNVSILYFYKGHITHHGMKLTQHLSFSG